MKTYRVGLTIHNVFDRGYRELTEDELDNLNSQWVSEQVWNWIH